ncbi:MAG: hypothetical protein AAGG44_10685 [Planctomycetota bacterium]
MHLSWHPQIDLSAFHTAWCCASFPQRTEHCAPPVRSAAGTLSDVVLRLNTAAAGASSAGSATPTAKLTVSQSFWHLLFAFAPHEPTTESLTKRLCSNLPLGVSPVLHAELVPALQACKDAFREAFPKYVDEMPLRIGPLQALWEAQGPGLLRMTGKQTTPDLLAEAAHIYLVQPILGGSGYPTLRSNAVHFEGVMTNEVQGLPETLRLSWLLAQLDFERPVYSELINRWRLRTVASLAMLPASLAAGEELDLCRLDLATLSAAMDAWLPDLAQTNLPSPNVAAEVVMTWWETFIGSQPAWTTALTGLDRMLD